jgi:DNA polymerase I-like protein with 3'-5' exonuclease and polymerase domains
MMTQIAEDFKALAAVIRGEFVPEDIKDPIPNPIYKDTHPRVIPSWKVVGADTESVGSKIWSVQFAYRPGEAYFVRADNKVMTEWLREWWADPEVLVVLHHAAHDLPMLAQLGIRPKRWTDTMLMANLLQNVPKGLKALAFRLCMMPMQSYSSLVDPITEARTLTYLSKVVQFNWPPVQHQIEKLMAGEYKMVQPQPPRTAAKTAITAFAKGNVKGRDLYDRWQNAPASKTAEILGILGPLHAATLEDVEFEKAKYYACRDSDATLRVYHHLYPRIVAMNLVGPLERDCDSVPMVMDMKKCGMWVDQPYTIQLGKDYDKRKHAVVGQIKDLIGRLINPASTDQVGHLLFRELGLRAKKRTKGGSKDSTDSEVLEMLKDKHPVVPMILSYRELDKMKGTFVDGVLDNCRRYEDGRCRTDITMIKAATGRFAARDPNLLAYPQEDRSDEGKHLRDAFVAGEGKVFVSGDYSQIELRLLADQANEPTMKEMFWKGIDIHLGMAAKVHRIALDQVTGRQRYGIKKVNFGIPYGITEAGLFKFLEPEGWSKKECHQLIDDWRKDFSAVPVYMNGIYTYARRYGYVKDWAGRIRLIPEVKSAHEYVRQAGLRQAGNMPIQTGANSILKEAMRQLTPFYHALQEQGYYIWPLLPIHDDLLWEMDAKMVRWVIPAIKSIMENCVTLSVPLVVDFKVGPRWGSMEKYKV